MEDGALLVALKAGIKPGSETNKKNLVIRVNCVSSDEDTGIYCWHVTKQQQQVNKKEISSALIWPPTLPLVPTSDRLYGTGREWRNDGFGTDGNSLIMDSGGV